MCKRATGDQCMALRSRRTAGCRNRMRAVLCPHDALIRISHPHHCQAATVCFTRHGSTRSTSIARWAAGVHCAPELMNPEQQCDQEQQAYHVGNAEENHRDAPRARYMIPWCDCRGQHMGRITSRPAIPSPVAMRCFNDRRFESGPLRGPRPGRSRDDRCGLPLDGRDPIRVVTRRT